MLENDELYTEYMRLRINFWAILHRIDGCWLTFEQYYIELLVTESIKVVNGIQNLEN